MRTLKLILSGWQSVGLVVFIMLFFNMEVSGAALMSRIIYRKTRNPYIAGLISAILITVISCSNTFTTLSAGSAVYTTF